MYTSYRCLKLERAQLIRDISGINTQLTDVSQKAALYFRHFDNPSGSAPKARPVNFIFSNHQRGHFQSGPYYDNSRGGPAQAGTGTFRGGTIPEEFGHLEARGKEDYNE